MGPAPLLRVEVSLPAGTDLAGEASPALALSPDGGILAFIAVDATAVPRLYLHFVNQDSTVVVPGSDWAQGPFFSPDGDWIAYGSGRALYRGLSGVLRKSAVDLGRSDVVCPLDGYAGGSWGDNEWIIFAGGDRPGLWRVRARGGVPEAAATAFDFWGDASPRPVAWPQVLPGGRRALLVDWQAPPNGALCVANLQQRAIVGLGAAPPPGRPVAFARWVQTGYVIRYTHTGNRGLQAFDARMGLAHGPITSLVDGGEVATDARKVAMFACSSGSSHVAYAERGEDIGNQTWLWSRVPAPVEGTAGEQGPFSASRESRPSHDGTRLAFPDWNGRLIALDDMAKRWIETDVQSIAGSPVWSTDDSLLAVVQRHAWGYRLGLLKLGERVVSQVLYAGPGQVGATSFSPDRQWLVCQVPDPKDGNFDLVAFPTGRPSTPIPVVDGPMDETDGVVSPDGRWLAYVSAMPGGSQVCVRSFLGSGEPRCVFPDGGLRPRWSPGGDELYVQREDDIVAVPIDRDGYPASDGATSVYSAPGLRAFEPTLDPRGFWLAVLSRRGPPFSSREGIVVVPFEQLGQGHELPGRR